jgi:anti-anti-sigma factor
MAEWAEDGVLYADKQLVISRTDGPAGLSACGAIDVFNVDAFAQILAASLEKEGDLSLDLRSLEFCDVSGIRALVSVASGVNDGRRLVVHGLPAQLRNVLTLVGWSDVPGLVIHDADKTC